MELEITWNRALRVWWAYFWRNLLAIVASGLIGALVGFVFGLIFGMLGVPAETVKFLMIPVGIAIGIAISIVPIKMILGKDFGEFRLALVQKNVDMIK